MAKKWLSLHRSLKVNPDMIIDNAGISDHKFKAKVIEANRRFKFDWPLEPTTQEEFNKMHKDMETAPKDQAHHLLGIHNALHVREAGSKNASQIQIVWSKSLGQFYRKLPIWYDMPKDSEPFAKSIKHGDVFLGYPYVGKSPETCMLQRDNLNLPQTCRLHNKISCDIVISLTDQICDTDERLLEWYDENKVTMFSKEDMLKYNGWAKIGEVINQEQLPNIDRNNLTIDYGQNQ